MSAHTKGPWTFSTAPQPNGCPIVGARGLMVAMLAHSIHHADQKDEALANARLIAAAPDLLEALQAFNVKEEWIVAGTADTLVLRVPLAVIQKAAAAVAKAIVEPQP